jgi:colicin import membrane protein
VLDPTARPAPLGAIERRRQMAAFLVLSLALHGILYAAFWEQPRPLASVGIEAITVDLVLGANTEAGLATTPGENELQAAAPAEEVKPNDEQVEQQERATEVRPETPVAETETKPDEAIEVTEEQPVQKKEATPQPKQTSAGAPSNTASGIGRGRSDADTNYRGQVAAHLTRHKQYPPAARRNSDQGTASVSFTIDGSGRVTAASLVRGSGHISLDHEVEAMVRRASPFPAPPGRRPMSFTVPITFKLQ